MKRGCVVTMCGHSDKSSNSIFHFDMNKCLMCCLKHRNDKAKKKKKKEYKPSCLDSTVFNSQCYAFQRSKIQT